MLTPHSAIDRSLCLVRISGAVVKSGPLRSPSHHMAALSPNGIYKDSRYLYSQLNSLIQTPSRSCATLRNDRSERIRAPATAYIGNSSSVSGEYASKPSDRSMSIVAIYNDAATTAALPPAPGKLNMAICHAWVLTIVVVVAAGAAPHLQAVRGASDGASASAPGGCDLFRGRWVADKSYPLYDASTCPFVPDVFDCRRNGRPDDDYLKFRWSPANCRLPRSGGSSQANFSIITANCSIAAQLTHSLYV